jgi:hypothetical protein
MTAAHLSTALRRCKFHRLYCYRNPAISPPLAIVKSTDTVKVARAIRTQPIQVMKHGGRMTTSPISEPAATTLRMLEVFGSVGATRFTMTWTNTAGMPRSPRSLQQLRSRSCNGRATPKRSTVRPSIMTAADRQKPRRLLVVFSGNRLGSLCQRNRHATARGQQQGAGDGSTR